MTDKQIIANFEAMTAQQTKSNIEIMQAVDRWGKLSSWISVAGMIASIMLGIAAGILASRL